MIGACDPSGSITSFAVMFSSALWLHTLPNKLRFFETLPNLFLSRQHLPCMHV